MKTILAYLFGTVLMMLTITNSSAQSMPSASEPHEALATISMASAKEPQPETSVEDKKEAPFKRKKQKEAKKREDELEDTTSDLLLTTP